MNPLCHTLNIKHPILQGGMGNISDPGLAAAVSEAGGLGTIGVGTMPIHEVEEKIKQMKEATTKPCCVNIPLSVHPNVEEIMNLVINYRIPVVSLSAGNPAPYIKRFHAHGIKVICVTAAVKQAVKAEASGADVIVCEGYEAAGINSNLESTTMTLVPQIAKHVSVPLVAAGGIADGRGLAAALSLGASGVQMGTRFIATKEAPYHSEYKNKILEATDSATTIVGRPYNKIRRLMKTPYSEVLLQKESKGMTQQEFMEMTSEAIHIKGALHGQMEDGFINSGQIAGLIADCPSVHDLIQGMLKEADSTLNRVNSLLERDEASS